MFCLFRLCVYDIYIRCSSHNVILHCICFSYFYFHQNEQSPFTLNLSTQKRETPTKDECMLFDCICLIMQMHVHRLYLYTLGSFFVFYHNSWYPLAINDICLPLHHVYVLAWFISLSDRWMIFSIVLYCNSNNSSLSSFCRGHKSNSITTFLVDTIK